MDVDTSPLKRCSSAPVIPNTTPRIGAGTTTAGSSTSSGANSVAGATARTPAADPTASTCPQGSSAMTCETPPAPNIFSRTRRYSSGSFSPLATGISSHSSSSSTATTSALAANPSPVSGSSNSAGPLRLTPRVSQLRKEECADISNTREVSHERGLHNQLQISQSWEDLTIVTESWSCRDDLGSNPPLNCSSPSPTSSRHHPQHPLSTATQPPSYGSLRYPFGMSPSPTRKTFATRRSMSPNHVRPSQLCPVKRKFDMDDSCGGGSPPPHKKMFLDVVARGSSPIHSLPMCASPDSGTYEGRTTPKLFISKLCSSNSRSSFSSASASPTSQLEGMNEGVGNGGPQIGGEKNSSNNSSSSSSAEEAKDIDSETNKANDQQQLGDHPMLDVSKEANCDKENSGGVVVAGEQGKEGKVVDQAMSADVDDGIGEEEVVAEMDAKVDAASGTGSGTVSVI